MKTSSIQILSLFILLICLFGCLNEEVVEPVAEFTISETNVTVGQQVTITSTGKGEYFTVFPGDQGHVYGNDGATGFPMNAAGKLFYTYGKAGTYQITLVATEYTRGSELKINTSTQSISVVDTANQIDRILVELSLNPNAPQSVRRSGVALTVEGFPDNSQNIKIPVYHHSRYGHQFISELQIRPQITPELTSARYRIEQADGTDVTLDISANANEIPAIAHYNFNQQYVPVDYNVTANTGETRTYKVMPVVTPEFSTVRVEGMPAANVRLHPLKQNEFYATLPIDAESDIANSVLLYELFDNRVNVDFSGNTFSSGDILDLDTIRSLQLTFQQPQFEDVFNVTSEIQLAGLPIPEITSFTMDTITLEPTLVEDGNPRIYEVVFDLPKTTYFPEFTTNLEELDVLVNNIPQTSGESPQNFLQSSTKEYILSTRLEGTDEGIDLSNYFFLNTILRVRVE